MVVELYGHDVGQCLASLESERCMGWLDYLRLLRAKQMLLVFIPVVYCNPTTAHYEITEAWGIQN